MIRLVRRPSLWSDFFGRLLFAIVWVGGFVVFSYWGWRHRFGAPTFLLVILGIFDLIALGVIWDIVIRLWRTANQREPMVEIDRQPLAYGDSAQLRLIEANPQSITEMGIKLVGECYTAAGTDISQHRQTVISLTRVYEDELLRLKPASDQPVSRVVQIQLPKSAPADKVKWKIVVDCYLKQGGLIEHPFPLRVSDSA